jgi:two-component system, NarL family, invasion response regulator UvrY
MGGNALISAPRGGSWEDCYRVPANPPDDTPVQVLLVDDQASFRVALHDLVAATEGFAVAGEAVSGEAALAAASELSPDLVIIDKRMPGMGGIEATRLLTDRHPELVVVLISVEDAPDPTLLRSCGAAAFLRKQDLSPAALQQTWRSIRS